MKIKATDITRALDSRGTLTAVIVLMIVSALFALQSGEILPLSGSRGLVFPSANQWISMPVTSLWVNMALIFVVVVLMIYINKVFNVPRNITLLYAIFFVVLQTATPAVTAQFYSGTLMLVVVCIAMIVMFGLFSRPYSQSGVYMVFMLLSLAVSVQYAFAVYIPVFFVACFQMRIMNLRTVLAAIFGLLTPWWILTGFGVVDFDDFSLPQFSINRFFDATELALSALCVAVTAVLALAAYGLSLLKLMTYNARTRACNGLLTLITLLTILAMVIDFTNYLTYLPLLNFCTAFFLAHFFVIRNPVKSWIVIVTVIAIYYTFYIWRIFV